jgi:dihydrofolate reductase
MDGFVEGAGGELDWIVADRDNESENCLRNYLCCFDTIFFGRRAYEKLVPASIEGLALSEAERELFYWMHGMRKYVFSRRTKHVQGNAMVISGNIKEEVTRIRGEEGKDIWLCGGPDILKTFIDLDLVDDFVLVVQPVLLGGGKPLFVGNRTPLHLKLIDKRKLRSGAVILHYKPESRLKPHVYGSRGF